MGPASPSPFCTAQAHVCQLDSENGCSSCSRTCHANCASELCNYNPCGFCLSRLSHSIITHDNSPLCVEMQQRHGCHACEDLGCWATKPDCPGQLGRQLATINFAWLGSARICTVSEQLKNHVATYHQGPAGEPCRLRTRDFGGALLGDKDEHNLCETDFLDSSEEDLTRDRPGRLLRCLF